MEPQDHTFVLSLYDIFKKIQDERGDFVRLDYPEPTITKNPFFHLVNQIDEKMGY
jgi:hypothetical protein